MDDALGAPPGPPPAEPIDLSVLERIEGELDAVERALEQIDQGVFDGFPGLGQVADHTGTADTAAGDGAEPPEVRDLSTGTDALAPGEPGDPAEPG